MTQEMNEYFTDLIIYDNRICGNFMSFKYKP